MVKRLPWRVTAITPGLARSMKCGITPWLPSSRLVSETGAQAAGFGRWVSPRPPMASNIFRLSPVLVFGVGLQCSMPVGAWAYSALRRAMSWGKPPAARTTPREA
ncbi:hypothetical protein D3C85_1461940 [compost metagenome]